MFLEFVDRLRRHIGGLADKHAHADLTGLTTGDPHTQYPTQVEYDDHSARHDAGGADALVIDAAAATASLRTLGTTSTSAAPGTVDAAAGTGSVRTLGTGAAQAAAGNHTTPAMSATVAGHVPTPPNNTTTFLRGDGTWAAPSAGGTTVVITKAEVTSSFLTASGTYVNVTGMQIVVTTSSSANPVRIEVQNAAMDCGASATVTYLAQIYNTTDAAMIVELGQGGWANGYSHAYPMGRHTTLAASAKTIDLQLKSGSGNARFNQFTHTMTLVATEFR